VLTQRAVAIKGPASPGGNRSSRREGAEPAGDEGSADGKRGASAASTTKSRPDSGRDKRERPRGERAKDGGDDQHQAKDSPTTTSDRRSSRPTSVRISKGADAGSGGSRKERRHDEESNGGGEDDDSSFLTSSGGITPGRESRTTSSPIDDDEDDEDSTASYTTPRDHSSTTNGGSAKSRRMSLKVRENGVSSSEDHRKRGSGGSSGRRRVGSGNREREESEEEDNKDSKTEEEQDNDGQLDSDEEVEEVEEEGKLDVATVEYNARLRKFILACVENLMKTVTRWAVVVSTPFAIAYVHASTSTHTHTHTHTHTRITLIFLVDGHRGELRVVDITRYVNGTLVILDGLKLGHRSQRSASGRDLSASKVDKSVQNPIHVAVNILLKKLLKIKNRVNTLSSKRLPRFYQAFYAVQNVRAAFVLIVVSCVVSGRSLRPALLACVCSFMKRERPRGTTRRCTCRSRPRCRIRPSTRRSWRLSSATTPSPLRRLGPTRSNSLRAPTFRYRSRNRASLGRPGSNERVRCTVYRRSTCWSR